MHPRYPAKQASELFSRQKQIDLWRSISIHYMQVRAEMTDMHEPTRERFNNMIETIPQISEAAVATREQTVGHEVVAFLQLLEEQFDRNEFDWMLHLGLTSSDLVENATLTTMHSHLAYIQAMVQTIRHWLREFEGQVTARAGRTHGQLAAPTSWGHQFQVIQRSLVDLETDMVNWTRRVAWKSPGPTGRSRGATYEAAVRVAHDRGVQVIPSTQVLPRDIHVAWAMLYLRFAGLLENLATQIRLGARAEVAEVREGAERSGSSAMPGKRNPIDCEKVCGLAVLVRGYAFSIVSNTALWEDRDLSNSALERVAFQDLAGTTEYMANVMTKVLANLQFDQDKAFETLHHWQVWTHEMQVQAQIKLGLSPTLASGIITYATSDITPKMCKQSGGMMVALDRVCRELQSADFSDADIQQWRNAVQESYNLMHDASRRGAAPGASGHSGGLEGPTLT